MPRRTDLLQTITDRNALDNREQRSLVGRVVRLNTRALRYLARDLGRPPDQWRDLIGGRILNYYIDHEPAQVGLISFRYLV